MSAILNLKFQGQTIAEIPIKGKSCLKATGTMAGKRSVKHVHWPERHTLRLDLIPNFFLPQTKPLQDFDEQISPFEFELPDASVKQVEKRGKHEKENQVTLIRPFLKGVFPDQDNPMAVNANTLKVIQKVQSEGFLSSARFQELLELEGEISKLIKSNFHRESDFLDVLFETLEKVQEVIDSRKAGTAFRTKSPFAELEDPNEIEEVALAALPNQPIHFYKGLTVTLKSMRDDDFALRTAAFKKVIDDAYSAAYRHYKSRRLIQKEALALSLQEGNK